MRKRLSDCGAAGPWPLPGSSLLRAETVMAAGLCSLACCENNHKVHFKQVPIYFNCFGEFCNAGFAVKLITEFHLWVPCSFKT